MRNPRYFLVSLLLITYALQGTAICQSGAVLQSFGIKKLLFEGNGPQVYISVLEPQYKKPKLVARGVMAVCRPTAEKSHTALPNLLQ